MSGAAPQAPGIDRVDLQEHDLSIPGRHVVQNRVEITPEAPPFRHFHFGEEVIYVLDGELEYQIEGVPARVVRAGEALVVPAEAVHAVRAVGGASGTELATFIVAKDKPLITLVS